MCCRYYLPGKIKLFFSVWSTTGKSVSHLIEFFWESKMETFYEAISKETYFSLYLEKGQLFIQLFWPLSFTMVAKKNTYSVEFRLPWKKKNLEKSNVVKHDLRVESLKSTNWNSKVRFQIQKSRVQINELRVQIDESRVQLYEFKNLLINEHSSKSFKTTTTGKIFEKNSSFHLK